MYSNQTNVNNMSEKWYMKHIRHFFENVSIHGLRFVTLPNVHLFERIFWVLTVITTTVCAFLLAKSNWDRYWENPTVMSVRKDFINWENPFPAVTGCFVERNDLEKTQQYIYNKWKISPSDEKYEYYSNFIADIANISYESMEKLEKYEDDESLNEVNLVELVYKVHPDMDGNLVTFQTKIKTEWTLILTERGLCFSVNSKFAHFLSPKINGVNSTEDIQVPLIKCHYSNLVCYGRYDSDSHLYINYYVHSYYDVIHSSSEMPLLVKENEEIDVNFRMIESTCSPDVRHLNLKQRQCRFDDEPFTKNMPYYSKTLCYIECRYRLAVKLCGCKPFFYHFFDGKVCDVNGMLCLAENSFLFTESPKKIGCDCPQPCEIITYLKDLPKRTTWDGGFFDQRVAFRWGVQHPKTKYYRDIIFGAEELIVSIGGILSLFLGTSFITLTEVFFLLIRMAGKIAQEYWNRRKIHKPKPRIATRKMKY